MSRAILIAPDVFLLHASRLRARKLQQIAMAIPGELRIHALPSQPSGESERSTRTHFSSVLRHFQARIR